MITSFKSTPFWPTFYQFLTIFLHQFQKLPLKDRAWTSWWYYIFLERNKIYEQSTVLTTKTGLLCSLCKFFASSRALARRRRPCEPFPRASSEPFPLALCARVAPHELCTLYPATTSHLRAITTRLRHFGVQRSSLHFACVPPDSCMQFLYTLSYFFTIVYAAHPWNSLRNRWQN